jgi:N-methylhydantoinase A/oxoprolinase/acetone carboxylase beta subunit
MRQYLSRNSDNYGQEEVGFIQGTTIGINAIGEAQGARVVLITTEGFEDVLENGSTLNCF